MTLLPQQYVQINQAVFSFANAYRTRMQLEDPERETGFSLSDRAVLMILGQFGQQNAQQLASRMRINPGTISVRVQRLVTKNLVQRHQDPADRRTWWLTLTEAGHLAYQDTILGTVAYTRDFLHALDSQEQEALHALLLRVASSLGYDWEVP